MFLFIHSDMAWVYRGYARDPVSTSLRFIAMAETGDCGPSPRRRTASGMAQEEFEIKSLKRIEAVGGRRHEEVHRKPIFAIGTVVILL